MVHSDADGCCWSGKTTEESGSSCCLHQTARLDDGTRDQFNIWKQRSAQTLKLLEPSANGCVVWACNQQ